MLFSCWDRLRVGHIPVNVLAENLISLGLCMQKDQVVNIIQLVSKNNSECDQIEIREFIKIFEKNSFQERYTKQIKIEVKQMI